MSLNSSQAVIFINDQNNTSTNNSNVIMNFPIPLRIDNDYEIALGSAFLNYSWFNVTAAFNNQSFSYVFNGETFGVTLPQGYYNVSDLNNYMQTITMYGNGQYLVDNNGNNVYYLSFQTNPTYYAVTITATPIPTTLPDGWTNPNNITLSGNSPQLVISSNNFGSLIGFSTGSYPATPSTVIYQINSNITPEINPVVSCSINCNMVSNGILNTNANGTSIYQFNPNNITFGEQIQLLPFQYQFFSVVSSTYTQLVLQFTDQNGMPLGITDTAITISLILKRRQAYP